MGKTDCRTAIAQLEAFLETPRARPVEIADALNHIRECPACQRRMGHLVRLVEGEMLDEDLLTCQACEDLLPGYLTAEGLGAGGAAEWTDVRRHLAACPHCTAVYASLADLAALAYGNRGLEPPRTPEPNLSFLRTRETSDREEATAPEQAAPGGHAAPLPAASPGETFRRAVESDLWQQAARGVYRLTRAIPVLIGQVAAAFGALAAPLTVQLAPVPLYRSKRPFDTAEEARDFIELLELPHRETNVTLKVSLGPVYEGLGSLALALKHDPAPQPIAQARVTLRDADGVLLEGAFTGEDGVVLFRDLDAGAYLIRAEHAGQAWEFPLSLAQRAET